MAKTTKPNKPAHEKAEQILQLIRKNGELNKLKDEMGVRTTYAPLKPIVDAVNRDCTLADMHDELEDLARKLQELANKLIRLQ